MRSERDGGKEREWNVRRGYKSGSVGREFEEREKERERTREEERTRGRGGYSICICHMLSSFG